MLAPLVALALPALGDVAPAAIARVLVQAALLSNFAFDRYVTLEGKKAATVAALAMGVQNATITRISSGVVRTTHLTGIVTDLGHESAQLAVMRRVFGKRTQPGGGETRGPSVQRLVLLASILVAFIAGSASGAWIYLESPGWSMLAPLVLLAWIIVADLRTPICEIEEALVAELEGWMREQRARLSRTNDLAGAMDYMLKRWPAFTRFLDDGRVCLSNNAAERALRGIALGRKSWLFAGSDRGGERAAAMYSLIVTAKLNNVDPQAWLADVLGRIAAYPAKRIDELLPWNWQARQALRSEAA